MHFSPKGEGISTLLYLLTSSEIMQLNIPRHSWCSKSATSNPRVAERRGQYGTIQLPHYIEQCKWRFSQLLIALFNTTFSLFNYPYISTNDRDYGDTLYWISVTILSYFSSRYMGTNISSVDQTDSNVPISPRYHKVVRNRFFVTLLCGLSPITTSEAIIFYGYIGYSFIQPSFLFYFPSWIVGKFED